MGEEMEETTLGEWLTLQIEFLRGKGFKGDALKVELRRLVWLHKRDNLLELAGDARTMEEAWRTCAECLEQELDCLMSSMPEMSVRGLAGQE
jgi:hypothetical protein